MHKLILLLPVALLAACDRGPDVDMTNASVSEVANEMKRQAGDDDSFVNPGKWQQTVTMVDMTAPGMPPQIRDAMKQSVGESQVHETCLTPEQAKSPREDFFAGADKNCRYEHFKWGSGKVDIRLLCKHPQATQTMELTGDYEPDRYTMAMTASTKGKTAAEEMVMKMRVDAKRIGRCSPSAKS